MTGNCNKTATTQRRESKGLMRLSKNCLPDTLIKRVGGSLGLTAATAFRKNTDTAGAGPGRRDRRLPSLTMSEILV